MSEISMSLFKSGEKATHSSRCKEWSSRTQIIPSVSCLLWHEAGEEATSVRKAQKRLLELPWRAQVHNHCSLSQWGQDDHMNLPLWEDYEMQANCVAAAVSLALLLYWWSACSLRVKLWESWTNQNFQCILPFSPLCSYTLQFCPLSCSGPICPPLLCGIFKRSIY